MGLNKVTYVDKETTIYAQNLNDIQDAVIALEQGGGGGGGGTAEDITYDPEDTYTSGTVGEALNDINVELNGSYQLLETIIGANALSQGGFKTGGLDQTDATFVKSRVRCNGYYPVTPGETCTFNLAYTNIDPYFSIQFYAVADFTTSSTSTGSWVQYSGTKTFTVPSGVNYVRFSFKTGNAGTAAISPDDFTLVELETTAKTYRLNIDQNIVFVNKGVNVDGTVDNTFNQLRIINNGFIPVEAGKTLKISQLIGYELSVSFFETNETAEARTDYINWTDSINATIPSGTNYIRVIVRKSSNSRIYAGEIDELHLEYNEDGIEQRLQALEGATANGTVIGSDFIVRKLHVEEIGSLTYLQSFCKYNGKYYSTDGEHIGVQNADFSTDTSATLSLGHGNAFQLGSSDVAYISGWDDQTLYAVDLSTLTIDSTIDLGTTGYTTAVVDDLNNIAYIFQRDSNPNTVTNYNFIVYDLAQEQIISTRVINAFGAMQAADYYDGKIAILWGTGTSELPSGMAVYNTAGDILARFNLDVFASTEPEGIFIERDGSGILVSDVNKKVYRVTDVHN